MGGGQGQFTGTAEMQIAAQNIKNQRKTAMAARMRPRSQTGNPNAKNANLFWSRQTEDWVVKLELDRLIVTDRNLNNRINWYTPTTNSTQRGRARYLSEKQRIDG